ncbi:hypothetical protein B4080_1990 [Bacillus cereus]|nr:hypothetical protein B4080_1990 [Bacillus cereus]
MKSMVNMYEFRKVIGRFRMRSINLRNSSKSFFIGYFEKERAH